MTREYQSKKEIIRAGAARKIYKNKRSIGAQQLSDKQREIYRKSDKHINKPKNGWRECIIIQQQIFYKTRQHLRQKLVAETETNTLYFM